MSQISKDDLKFLCTFSYGGYCIRRDLYSIKGSEDVLIIEENDKGERSVEMRLSTDQVDMLLEVLGKQHRDTEWYKDHAIYQREFEKRYPSWTVGDDLYITKDRDPKDFDEWKAAIDKYIAEARIKRQQGSTTREPKLSDFSLLIP